MPTFIDKVNIIPGSAMSYVDVDLDNYISGLPSNTTGVILFIVNATDNVRQYGIRKNGSTDDRFGNIANDIHTYMCMGCDENHIMEIKVNLTDFQIYVIGYFTSDEAAFFTNAYNKSTANLSIWEDVDCSIECPSAIGAIFEFVHQGSAHIVGLRMNGSTDNVAQAYTYRHCAGGIIGLDGNGICEQYINHADVDVYLVGYITKNATFNLNATNVTPAGTATYYDLAALPVSGIAGIYEVRGISAYNWALRKNGSSDDIYHKIYFHSWGVCQADSSRIVEAKIANLNCKMYLVGYFTSSNKTPWHLFFGPGQRGSI